MPERFDLILRCSDCGAVIATWDHVPYNTWGENDYLRLWQHQDQSPACANAVPLCVALPCLHPILATPLVAPAQQAERDAQIARFSSRVNDMVARLRAKGAISTTYAPPGPDDPF